jgi:hypothetical protein
MIKRRQQGIKVVHSDIQTLELREWTVWAGGNLKTIYAALP